MRLTALHITGLWLQYPTIAIFYVKQLKLLSLHGGGKWAMVFHFFDIKNLVNFIKKLAKLVEFTQEKKKFPISLSKDSEILPEKKTTKGNMPC
jgi:hypothetical protein